MHRIITRGIGPIPGHVADSTHLITRGYGLSVIEVGEIIVIQSLVTLVNALISLVTLSLSLNSSVAQSVDKESVVADELGMGD